MTKHLALILSLFLSNDALISSRVGTISNIYFVTRKSQDNQTTNVKSELNLRTGKSPFRYIIFYNSVDNMFNSKLPQRTLSVLIEQKAFSEENLNKLLQLIGSRYPAPNWLNINVYTSLEQILTPEEADTPKISGGGKTENEMYDYPYALIIRFQENEIFRYTANPPTKTLKTVIIKGKDPFR